jgi:ATP-binding cassette subfamily C protein
MKNQIKAERVVHQLEGNNFGVILQLIKGIPTLKISGTEIKAFIYWFKGFITLRDKTIILEKNKNVQKTINSSFALVSITIVYFALFKLSSDITTGRFIAFNAVLGAFLFSITGLSNAVMSAINSLLIYDRFKPIIEELPENYGAKDAPVNIEGNIELQNVVFKYDENTPIIIDNISLKIKKGEYIALVGPSGSGKSTIIRLLLGFNESNSGTIIYDGQDLKNIDLKLLRKQIGVVLQDGNLFGGDIFTNIVGSAANLTMDDAWNAAKEAALDKDIEEMPMGMFTIINEDGGTFSGGQKQRLMIARALVNKPKILIFDEATSALDNRTQAIVTESLDKLKITRIVVAHRLSTIKNADRIILMESGHIVEEGNYDSLMKKKGVFYHMAHRQL